MLTPDLAIAVQVFPKSALKQFGKALELGTGRFEFQFQLVDSPIECVSPPGERFALTLAIGDLVLLQ
jgi:hypothetical protein